METPTDAAASGALGPDARNALLVGLLRSIPAAVAICRLTDLRIVFLNPAARRQLAVKTSEPNLRDFFSLTALRLLDAEILPKAQVLGSWSGRCELRDARGSDFVTSIVVTGGSGGPAGHLCFFAQEAAVEQEGDGTHFTDRELLHALLQATPDSVYFKDENSRFLRMSWAQARKFGLPDPAAAIGQTDFDFFSNEHASLAFADEKQILATGQPLIDQEEKETWEDGHVTWVSSTKSPLRDHSGRIIGTFGISRDITARKEAEADKRQMEVQLQLASKLESLGRLAAGVAHEINTPTQFIADNTHFLTDAFDKIASVLDRYRALRTGVVKKSPCDDELRAIALAETEAEIDYLLGEIPRCLQQSLDGLGRVSRIVCSLKEFAHPNSPDLAPADLNRTIETAIAVSRHEWKYVAEIATEFDPDLPAVPCMVDEFNQVILNLVINSSHAIADALKQRGGERGLITIRTRQAAPWAIVEVEDTGTGIPAEIRERIFEPFFTTKEVGKGTGQGLAIAHTVIVKHHHGGIDVTSEVGRGTKFTLRLPLTMECNPAPAAVAV